MAWTHRYGEGRVFYTTLGHGPGTFENPTMQALLANAVRWAAGA
jgi:type 1 glutamine amidotransferase